jgi:hypothetical protein
MSRAPGDSSDSQAIIAAFASRFRHAEWPGTRAPRPFYDPRSLARGADQRSALHAKIAVADSSRALVGSANLTDAALKRNIEKEGKNAIKWTRLSCRVFAANAVRLQLHALAHNLGNFMRTLAMPTLTEPWSLTSLCEKLIKIGAKVVSHGRYITFQMAEVAVSRQMFADILSLITRLRAPPAPA